MESTAGKSAKTSDWLVYRVAGAKSRLLGTVTAPDYASALALAFAEFHITPAERKRIIAQETSGA